MQEQAFKKKYGTVPTGWCRWARCSTLYSVWPAAKIQLCSPNTAHDWANQMTELYDWPPRKASMMRDGCIALGMVQNDIRTLWRSISPIIVGNNLCWGRHIPNSCAICRAIFGGSIYRFVTCLLRLGIIKQRSSQTLPRHSDGHSGPADSSETPLRDGTQSPDMPGTSLAAQRNTASQLA
jgi:hypothetical protein